MRNANSGLNINMAIRSSAIFTMKNLDRAVMGDVAGDKLYINSGYALHRQIFGETEDDFNSRLETDLIAQVSAPRRFWSKQRSITLQQHGGKPEARRVFTLTAMIQLVHFDRIWMRVVSNLNPGYFVRLRRKWETVLRTIMINAQFKMWWTGCQGLIRSRNIDWLRNWSKTQSSLRR